jgi:tetratricopeptide (TPR) repeat protein
VVDQARRDIVHGNIEAASKRVYELITVLTSHEPVTFE